MKESKVDLATAIGAFVAGFIIAFLVTSVILPQIKSEQYKTIEQTIESSLNMPDEEIFNTRALNPTVEVCVGCISESEEE